jgi:hypothetical protein
MKYKTIFSLLYLKLHVGKDRGYFYEIDAVILNSNLDKQYMVQDT